MRHDDGMDEQREYRKWLLRPVMREIAELHREIAAIRRQQGRMEKEMSQDTDRIETALTGLTDPIVSVETAILKLVELVRTNNSDPAAVERVLATIESAKGRIAAAAMAGTVADPNAPAASRRS